MNWRNLKDFDPRKYDKDDLLNLIGLETRREPTDWILPTLTAFSVGVLVGAGVGLLLAPKSGRELRDDLRNRLNAENEGSQPTVSSVPASGTAASRAG